MYSHANVALNLQPKATETNDSASESKSAEAAQNREYKIRKTDDDSKMKAPFVSVQDEKMELSSQSSNVESKANENWSKQTSSKFPANNDMVQGNLEKPKQEDKMEIDTTEQLTELVVNNEDDSDDIGEIHIVSKLNLNISIFDSFILCSPLYQRKSCQPILSLLPFYFVVYHNIVG